MIYKVLDKLSSKALTFDTKYIIIFGVLSFAALLGFKVSLRLLVLTILALSIGLGLLVLTRRLQLGILLVTPVSFLVPWTVSTGTMVPINATILFVSFLFCLWILQMIVIKKKITLVSSGVNTPALLFILATCISLIYGNAPLIPMAYERASLPAQLGAWALYVLSVGMILLSANALHEIGHLKLLIWGFLVFGSAYIILILIYGQTRVDTYIQQGIGTSIFWIFMAVLGFSQFLFNTDLPLGWRLVACGISIAGLILRWVQGKEWIAGWLPPLIGVYLLIWLRSRKFGLVITVILIMLLIPRINSLITQVDTPDQQWSTYTRTLVWPMMFEFVKASPIFGVGFANYYHYTPLYSYGGYFVQLNSHNNYLDIAVQTGLLGSGLFFWIVLELSLLGWRLRKQIKDGFSQAYINSMLAGLVAMLVAGTMADWFLPFLYNIGFPGFRTSVIAWLLLGGLISLDVIQQKKGEVGNAT